MERGTAERETAERDFFSVFILLFFLTKKQQQQQQQQTNSKYISQNKGHAYILYPSRSQVVEFISSEDFKEKRDYPSDLLAPIETMKRTKSKQVKKAVDKKKNKIKGPEKLLIS